MRTARSSGRLLQGGACLSACWNTHPLGVGLETQPPGVALETPRPDPSTSPLGTCNARWDTTPPREQNDWQTGVKT